VSWAVAVSTYFRAKSLGADLLGLTRDLDNREMDPLGSGKEISIDFERPKRKMSSCQYPR